MLKNDKYETSEYLGRINYNDKKEVMEAIEELNKEENKFTKNKMVFITETQTNLDSANVLEWMYRDHIKVHEDIKGKDLYDFDLGEVEAIILTMPTIRVSMKNNLKAFIQQYFLWAVERGFINNSPCDGLDKSIVKVGKENLLKKIYLLDDFKDDFSKSWATCCVIKGESTTNKIQDVFINRYGALNILLSRYGIIGKKFRQQKDLKWSDIDYKNNIVHAEDDDGNNIQIPVDDFFIRYMTEIKEKTSLNEQEDNVFLSIGYLNPPSIYYKRIKDFIEISDMRNMTMGDFLKSRKLDLINEIAEERLLTALDFGNVEKIFNLNAPDYKTSLKNLYVEIFGEDRIAEKKVMRNPKQKTLGIYDENGKYIRKEDRVKNDEEISS